MVESAPAKDASHQPPQSDENSAVPSTSAVASSQGREEHKERQGRQLASSESLQINTSERIEIVQSFDQLGLPEQLLRGKSAPPSHHQCRSLRIRL